jgi:hypothetical protein
MSNETMDIGNMEAGTMRSGTIPGSNLGVVFCQLITSTTIIVSIVSIIIVIITIVCIPSSIIHPHRRPSSLNTQSANANMKTHLSAVGFEPTRSCLQQALPVPLVMAS